MKKRMVTCNACGESFNSRANIENAKCLACGSVGATDPEASVEVEKATETEVESPVKMCGGCKFYNGVCSRRGGKRPPTAGSDCKFYKDRPEE